VPEARAIVAIAHTPEKHRSPERVLSVIKEAGTLKIQILRDTSQKGLISYLTMRRGRNTSITRTYTLSPGILYFAMP